MPSTRHYIQSFEFFISKDIFTFVTVHCAFYCFICLLEQVGKLMFLCGYCQHIKLKHFVDSTLRPWFSQRVCSHKLVETRFLNLCALPRQALSAVGIKLLLVCQKKMKVPCNLNVLNLLRVLCNLVVFNSLYFYLGLASCQFNFVSE